MAVRAFGHGRVEVQETALDLISAFGLPEGAEAAVITGQASYLAPVLTSKAAALRLPAAPPAPADVTAGSPLTPAPAAKLYPPRSRVRPPWSG
jgi:hypothetical protein